MESDDFWFEIVVTFGKSDYAKRNSWSKEYSKDIVCRMEGVPYNSEIVR